MQLTRKRVIATAVGLIERDGVQALSMHRLATELGSGLLPLYNHVPSQGALLDAIADHIMSGIAPTVTPDAHWLDQIRAQAMALRQAALAHPRCTMLVVSRPPASAAVLRPVEHALRTLRRAGFDGPDAVRTTRAIGAYIIGTVLCEVGVVPGLADLDEDDAARPRLQLRPDRFPQVTALAAELSRPEHEVDFEYGLDLLVHAIAARHEAKAIPVPV